MEAATSNRQPGAEPIPGYRLLAPLGRGGFGEVWKCEAPGGLFKAMKFVCDGDNATPATQELQALQRVKTLRHPFILSLERLEVIDDVLIILMELADESLQSRFQTLQDQGAIGLPRDELLSYLHEAAEALDWMNFTHGLQHLDIKPHNLFLVCNHVKVADFGLVHCLGDAAEMQSPMRVGGVSPLYAAPEMLRGTLSRNSDQYSLAVVYQQLLTGTVPFWHENVYDLIMQHLTGDPDLGALSEEDRPVIARALSKVPEQRFASCQEFVNALHGGKGTSVRRSGQWRQVLTGKGGGSTAEKPTGTRPPATIEPATPLPPSRSAAAWEQTRQALPATPTRRIRAVAPSPVPTALREPVPEPPAPEPRDHTPQPTAVTLPGYRFQSCLSQGPLGDLWKAETGEGKVKRALALLNFVRYDARLIGHLQALRDPVLPPAEVHWSPAERLVVLTDTYDGTLRDRFEQCQASGHPGIPRQELLVLLRSAAEALDALYARHGQQHLGIHPRNLLVDEDRLWLAEFGLIPLVWLPTGQSAGQINGRYAAPELFERRLTCKADQYSLALIYAEMLTGVHPRPNKPTSGTHRRVPGHINRPSSQQRTVKVNLDLLPAHDRAVIGRALSTNPDQRFESCTALVVALEDATRGTTEKNLYPTLPSVIPYASLMGEPAGPDTIIPPATQLVTALTAQMPNRVEGPKNTVYHVLPDGSWEYRCPLQLFPGAMRLKVDGFRQHWNAQIAEVKGDSFRLLVDVTVQRSFWERLRGSRHVEVDLEVEPLVGQQSRLTEAIVRVRYPGNEREQERILGMMAPQIFETTRLYLQASPEQRMRERWPLVQRVQIHPVLPDLEMGEVLEGWTKNISFGGISYRVKQKPAAEYTYLHLYEAPQALGFAILARTVRVVELEDGVEIGACFPRPQG